MKRLVLHSMHLSIRLAQGSQIYVCPHGRTTGGRSSWLNASMHITQWNENGAAEDAILVWLVGINWFEVFDSVLLDWSS